MKAISHFSMCLLGSLVAFPWSQDILSGLFVLLDLELGISPGLSVRSSMLDCRCNGTGMDGLFIKAKEIGVVFSSSLPSCTFSLFVRLLVYLSAKSFPDSGACFPF